MRYSKEKDMAKLRETEWTKKQWKQPYATIKDYALQSKVTLAWDLNEDAKRDQIFRITIGDASALIDKEEFMKATRFV